MRGFEKLKKWKRFRREFIQFVDDVGIQQGFYRLNLETLLRPIMGSEPELQLMLDEPTQYAIDAVASRLEGRLSIPLVYRSCMSIIKRMNEIMDELKILLTSADGQVNVASLSNSARANSIIARSIGRTVA
jgi:hypothetical protein